MTWPVENIVKISKLENSKQPYVKESTKHWASELITRHVRLSTYLFVSLVAYNLTWDLDQAAKGWSWTWMLPVVLLNLAVEGIFYGGWHWYLYDRVTANSSKIDVLKFNKNNPYSGEFGLSNLNRERYYTTLGFLQSSCWEMLAIRMWAIGSPILKPHYLDFWAFPLYSVAQVLIVPYWRELHFYLAHRMIHPWRFEIFGTDPGKVLYTKYHSLHHKSNNPGPWAGLSMHPVEHLIYYTCVLTPMVFSLHPLHFLFNKFHADLSPAPGHDGYDQPAGGSLFHYLHHAHFECNYGTPMVPLDVLFGTYEDGSKWAKKDKNQK